MADVALPSVATATPAAADTVAGVQGGAVKRFAVSGIGAHGSFSHSGTYAAGSLGAKAQQVVSVDDAPYSAVGDGVADDTAAVQAALATFASGAQTNSSFQAQRTVLFTSGKSYLLTATTVFTSLNGISIDATGATIFFDIDGPGFDFQSCNYPRIRGGNWIIKQDTANAEAFKLTRTKFASIGDLEIGSDNSGYDTLNRGFSLHSPGAGINDATAYNEFFNLRVVRLGKAYELRDDSQIANGASRVILNQFRDVECHCSNGPVYVGAVNNYFCGAFETQASGVQLTLSDNVNGVGSSENGFDLLYLAGSRTVSFGTNSRANTFTDRHGANSQNQARSTAQSIFGGNATAFVELNDAEMGGVRRLQPRSDRPSLMGGQGGINLLPYSNDFTKWTATDCTVAANTGLTDPDGNYSPNGAASLITQTAANGYIMGETAVLGNAVRHKQYSGRVWMHSASGGQARLHCQLWNGSAQRTLWQRAIYLPANTWVLGMIGMLPADSGSGDSYRLLIYPTQSGGMGAISVYEAGISKGFNLGHNKTNGATMPRGPSDAVVAENLAAQHLYLSGNNRENAMRAVTLGAAAPATGTWVAGDIVFNTAPTSGGKVGWVCVTGGAPGTWKTFGAID